MRAPVEIIGGEKNSNKKVNEPIFILKGCGVKFSIGTPKICVDTKAFNTSPMDGLSVRHG
jgi:hypothetical protein